MHGRPCGVDTLEAALDYGDGLKIWLLEAPSSHLCLWCCPKNTVLGQPLKPASIARRMFLKVSLYLILSWGWVLKGWRVWRWRYTQPPRRLSEGVPAAQQPSCPWYVVLVKLTVGVPSSRVLLPCSPVEPTWATASPATPTHCGSWA